MIYNWIVFINERFPIKENLPFLILLFFTSFVLGYSNQKQFINLINFYSLFTSFISTVLIFFTLRILDEIKDYEKDKIIHPNRPLVRGLITINEAKKMAFYIVLVNFILNLSINLNAIIFFTFTTFYSFLMYKEFFIREWIRKRVVLYAFSHAVIMILITLYIFFANFKELTFDYAFFAILNWFISNIFEFSRKMLLPTEEGFTDSYINQIGATKTLMIHYTLIFIVIYSTLYFISDKLINIFSFSIFVFTYFFIFFILNKTKKGLNLKVIKFSKLIGYFIILLFYLTLIIIGVIKLNG